MTTYNPQTGPFPVSRGVAAAAGGTFVATLLANALGVQNTFARVSVEIYLSQLSAGALLNAAGYLGECFIANKAGSVTFTPAIATSSNPVNSSTGGFELTHRVEASDVAFNGATAVLTINGSGDLICTVTNNNGGGISADVTVIAHATFMSVASGALVRIWQDQSGVGDANRNMLQSNPAQRPRVIGSDPLLNGQPSLRFDRAGTTGTTMLQVGAPSNSPVLQPYTIIAIGYDDANPAQQPWVANGNTNDWYLSSFNSVSNTPNFGSSIGPSNAFANLATDLTDTGQAVIYMAEFNDPSSSTIRINSEPVLPLQANGNIGAPGFTNGGNLPDQLGLGRAEGTTQNLNGVLAEVIVYRGILSNGDRQGLLTYLQTRYNLAVASLPVVAPILPLAVATPCQCWFRADLGIVL